VHTEIGCIWKQNLDESQRGIGREVIIEARGNADRARGQIMTADHGEIARGVIAAAIGTGVARCWHSNAYFSLFSSLFFFDLPNRFVQIPRDLS
jgi:hypothetical protein